ncbi:MAG: tyrosine decarboxylase MfnA [Candidatus Helarchaeota archaeon]
MKGCSEEKILRQLSKILGADMSYKKPGILGSMCTSPLEFANKIFATYLHKNLGDPGLWLGTWAIEKDVVKMLGELLHDSNATGFLVTGGTEANLIAMKTARDIHRYNGRSEIIVPSSAHASFDKAADLMRLKVIKVPLNEDYTVDIEGVEEAISKNTVAIVGIAGTTSLGTIDDIEKLSEIALERDIYLHVDAAFGGFVIPFLKKIGYDLPKFDFEVPGVMSITVDPHKMGLGPIPAGGILFRDQETFKKSYYNIPYLAGGKFKQATIVGTRSGASVIAVWAIMKYLGVLGYIDIVRKCMKITEYFAEQLRTIKGIRLVREPVMNIIGFTSDDYSIYKIDKGLRRKRWAIGCFPDMLRVVVMPHIQKSHVDLFIHDLQKILKSLIPENTPKCSYVI